MSFAFAVAARVPDLMLTGVELQDEYAALARANAARNGLTARIHTADLADLLAPEAIVLLRLGGPHYALHQQGDRTYDFPGDEPGPPRLREVSHLLGHLAELRSEQASSPHAAGEAEGVAPAALLVSE